MRLIAGPYQDSAKLIGRRENIAAELQKRAADGTARWRVLVTLVRPKEWSQVVVKAPLSYCCGRCLALSLTSRIEH